MKKKIFLNTDLHEIAKMYANEKYDRPSAYKSGYIVKLYKDLGGKFSDDNKEKPLKRWFNEKWQDINPNKTNRSYPVYRPTIRINKNTPLTVDEVDSKNLYQQAKLKQKLKDNKLPPFKKVSQ